MFQGISLGIIGLLRGYLNKRGFCIVNFGGRVHLCLFPFSLSPSSAITLSLSIISISACVFMTWFGSKPNQSECYEMLFCFTWELGFISCSVYKTALPVPMRCAVDNAHSTSEATVYSLVLKMSVGWSAWRNTRVIHMNDLVRTLWTRGTSNHAIMTPRRHSDCAKKFSKPTLACAMQSGHHFLLKTLSS